MLRVRTGLDTDKADIKAQRTWVWPLGFAVVSGSESYAQRLARHEEALRQREAAERKVAARCKVMAAVTEIDESAQSGTAEVDDAEMPCMPRRFEQP